MGIFAAVFFQNPHRLSSCSRSAVAKPASSTTHSFPSLRGGTAAAVDGESLRALGSPVWKKEAKAPGKARVSKKHLTVCKVCVLQNHLPA